MNLGNYLVSLGFNIIISDEGYQNWRLRSLNVSEKNAIQTDRKHFKPNTKFAKLVLPDLQRVPAGHTI